MWLLIFVVYNKTEQMIPSPVGLHLMGTVTQAWYAVGNLGKRPSSQSEVKASPTRRTLGILLWQGKNDVRERRMRLVLRQVQVKKTDGSEAAGKAALKKKRIKKKTNSLMSPNALRFWIKPEGNILSEWNQFSWLFLLLHATAASG